MNKSDFHIYNTSYFGPLLNGLQRSGVSIESLSSKGAIKRFNIQTPDNYIPLVVMHEFLPKVRKNIGVDNIASSFYSKFRLEELGEYGEFLKQCPDLLTVLLEGIKYEHTFQTNTRIKLDIKGPLTRFYTIYLDPPSEGGKIAEEIGFAMNLHALKIFVGESWKPISIQLTSNSSQYLAQHFTNENIRVEYGCPYSGVTFPTELLSVKNSVFTEGSYSPSAKLDTFSDSIYYILKGIKDGYIPSLNDFSNYFDVSERTITRSLVNEGISFSSLIKRFLFTKSLNLLNSDHLTVNDISQKLGYANSSNFLRAFKGWTNSTPDSYRREHIYMT